MNILDGQLVSQATKDELKIKVEELVKQGKKIPHLAAVLVGNNGASETYVGSKVRTCSEIGYKSSLIRLEESITEEELLNTIRQLNNDARCGRDTGAVTITERNFGTESDRHHRCVERCGRISLDQCRQDGAGSANIYSRHSLWYHAAAGIL